MIPVWRKNYQRYRSYFSHIVSQYKDRGDLMSYLEILLSLATVSIFALFALRPTLLTIAGLIREVESNTAIIAQLDDKIQNVTRAQTLYDREKNKIELLSNAIPTGVEPETVIRQIEGLSQKHSLTISSLTLGKANVYNITTLIITPEVIEGAPNEEGIAYLPITITASTSLAEYPQISAFISDLEHLRQPIYVKDFTLSTVRERGGRGLVLVVQGAFPYSIKTDIPPLR
jgi:hypothetical protein